MSSATWRNEVKPHIQEIVDDAKAEEEGCLKKVAAKKDSGVSKKELDDYIDDMMNDLDKANKENIEKLMNMIKNLRPRFVESDGLNSSDLLQNRETLNTLWSKYWPTIYGDKYIPLLDKEIRNHYKYKDIWTEAKQVYQDKSSTATYQKNFVNKYNEIYEAENFHIAIVAYTLETDLYKDFNKASRDLTVNNFESFQFKSIWYMLGFAIPQLDVKKEATLYRGLSDFQYPVDDLKKAQQSGTPIVLATSFVSSTTVEVVAEHFAKGTNNCLLYFTGRPNYGNSIADHSRYGEEEVLICPWSQWIVTSYRIEGSRQKVYLKPDRNQTLHPKSTNASSPYDSDCRLT